LTPGRVEFIKYRIERLKMAGGDDRGKERVHDEDQHNDARPSAPAYQVKGKEDEDAYLMSFLAQQAPAMPLPGMSYELRRGQSQLGHYFDTSRHPSARPAPGPVGSQRPQKVTKKDLERFRKQKEEKKRRKNQWLYES
jgi:hypothetical protein